MILQTGCARRLCHALKGQSRAYSAPTSHSVPPTKQKYIPTAGTYPKGFLAGSAYAGVKLSNTSTNDLALLVSETPCAAAAVFTRNVFQAAPVTVSKQVLELRNGDSCTRLSKQLGDEYGRNRTAVSLLRKFLATVRKLIGPYSLPIQKITSKIPALYHSLGSTHNHWLDTARAICTTDTFPKLLSRTFTLPSSPSTTYAIAGMTKGAGMIHPNMATLLSIICTDAAIAPSALYPLLRQATEGSFNSISIDGDTSTNDTVALLANGAAATSSKLITIAGGEDYAAFQSTLSSFMTDLAKLVVRDGEGATKFITIRVLGAPSTVAARQIAKSIATSSLVKTAMYGRDANWGRILCAIGYSHLDSSNSESIVIPNQTSVSFIPSDGSAELKLLVRGEPEAVDEARASEILAQEDLEILVRLRDGGEKEGMRAEGEEATVWTCDFSHEYVTINGDYRT
ncbi:Arginine biosynthesis bifunctional protein ArgJ, mitochondrial [Elasticomyces elasticus]|nr:Arginine biosynthesis bifunctional protein ArgJ, mitochondrial [Elasticomyces elasticus]